MSQYVAELAGPRPVRRKRIGGSASSGHRRAAAVALLVAIGMLATVGGDALGSRRGADPAPVTGTGSGSGSTAVDPGIDRRPHVRSSVVVQATEGGLADALATVRRAGGQVGNRLPLVNGFEAEVPGRALDVLEAEPSVIGVTLNRAVRFEEYSYDDSTTASSFARTSGATQAWSSGVLGQGVGVAVLDTGVSPMADFSGRLVHGPDLSGEGTIFDTYGHGTVMAGIVAGSGADSATRTLGSYTGVAPKAHVVAVKVAGRNGAVDVSTILQGMHWVSAYKDQFNIRVLNLSWGTKSTQSSTLDPLNYAVQRLWSQGIVVVVAAGNSGPRAGTITKPGDDPVVITVGSFDDKQNLDPLDDSVSSWSSRGPTAAGISKPDVLAPGRSLIATRSFGSYVEVNNPKALVSPSYIKGSGTSEAAAAVSGLAALLLSAHPSLTPDQIKALLSSTANPILGVAGSTQGAGRVQVGAALLAAPLAPASVQPLTATGLGSIEASRGGVNVQTDCKNDGVIDVIRGEIDARCEAWTGSAWTGSAWTGSAWTGSAWTGSAWTGSAWTGSAWTGGTWTGSAWTGSAWTGSAWTGSAWTGSAWTGSAWTGSAWTGSAWTGSAWTSAEYESTEFLNAFWGDKTPWNRPLPGEPAEDPPGAPGNGNGNGSGNGNGNGNGGNGNGPPPVPPGRLDAPRGPGLGPTQ